MFQNAMLTYYRGKYRLVADNYALALDNDVDGVHDMRVGLKRLKAFYNMLAALDDSLDYRKAFKPFKRLAKSSGGLRDAHVQQELLDTVNGKLKNDVSGYRQYLQRLESENIRSFREFADKRNPMKALASAEKSVERRIKKISEIRAETKAQGRFLNLRGSLVLAGQDNPPREETLHKVRILSKETHYSLEILQSCLMLYGDRDDFVTAIKKVHQALGKWHDYDVCLEHLDEYFAIHDVSHSSNQYHTLVRHIRKEKKNMAGKYKTAIKRFTAVAVTM